MPRRQATVRSRGLGGELRELRQAAGLSVRDVAKRLGWSAASVSRTENGLRIADIEEVAALLVIYGITGLARDRVLALTREAGRPEWWETELARLPSQLAALIGFETQASRIVDVALSLVPGQFQIAGYARSVILAAGVPASRIEARVATRLGRQALITKPGAPEFLAIIDEAALIRPIGGRETMAAQLRQICAIGRNPNVTVQVIPLGVGTHAGLSGAFLLLEFPRAATIVHLEHLQSSVFLDREDDIGPYVAAVDTLRRAALDPVHSIERIERIATEFES